MTTASTSIARWLSSPAPPTRKQAREALHVLGIVDDLAQLFVAGLMTPVVPCPVGVASACPPTSLRRLQRPPVRQHLAALDRCGMPTWHGGQGVGVLAPMEGPRHECAGSSPPRPTAHPFHVGTLNPGAAPTHQHLLRLVRFLLVSRRRRWLDVLSKTAQAGRRPRHVDDRLVPAAGRTTGADTPTGPSRRRTTLTRFPHASTRPPGAPRSRRRSPWSSPSAAAP